MISEKEKISSELATQEAAIEKQQLDILELERQLHSRGNDLSANRQRIREKEEEILVCQERINALKAARERANREIEELQRRAEGIVVEKDEASEKVSAMQTALAETESKLDGARAQLGNAQQAYSAKRADGKEQENARLRYLEEVAKIQQSEERLRTRLAYSDERVQTIRDERNKIEKQLESLTEKVTELTSQKRILTEQAEELDEQVATTTRDLELAREQVEKSKADILQLQGEIKTRQDRAGLLRKVLETYEDYPEGVRFLLRDHGQPAAFHGTLGDLLSVDAAHRRAIEAALGESAVAVVVDGALDAVEAI